jgi:hypothetical protein
MRNNLDIKTTSMTLSELETIVKQHMLLADEGVVKLLCAFVIAQRMETSPPWLFLVGASSGGKSMLLKALRNVQGYYALDDLTANTFVSGQQKKTGSADSPSLLDEFTNQSFIVLKDFTTILSKDKETKKTVIGQLRKIYDGDFSKRYGNGVEVKYEGKLGVLAGVTTKIYTTWGEYADMGERFLMYYFRQPDRHEMGYRVLDDSDDVAGDTALTEAFTTFIEGVAVPETLPLLDDDAKKAIVDLAEMATRARSGVERNEQSRKQEMKFAHDAEMPARFIKQLRSLAFGLIAINGDGKLTDGDKQMLYNIALDSIPKQRRTAMVELTKNAWMDQGAIAQAVKLPEEEVRRWLEELRALGVIESHRDVNKKLLWGLKEEYRRVMSRFESITMTDNTVENDGSDEDEEETVQWGVRI